ncbi:MAG TPA: heme-binding protein [Rubrobacteraceae bacterium]|nr:heme-binding protein [Rubrobacteraceae bacterium]
MPLPWSWRRPRSTSSTGRVDKVLVRVGSRGAVGSLASDSVRRRREGAGDRPADEQSLGLSTEKLSGMAQPGQPLFGGGIPLMRDGALVGAVGVSGGTVDQDQEVAEAGLAAFS